MSHGSWPRATQLALIAATFFCATVSADSSISIPTRAEAAKVNNDTVGVVFTHEELFHQLVHNMEDELEHQSRLRIVPIMGKNHVQSIYDLLYLKGVDLAMVRADAIEYVKRKGNYPNIQRLVKKVAKVSDEKIVIISRKEHDSLEALNGQPVSFGIPGSGEYVTGTVAFRALGIEPEAVEIDNTTAIERMKAGELAAMVYLLRAPDAIQTGDDLAAANAIKNLELGNELQLLELPRSDALSAIYTPGTLTHDDLPMLIGEQESIATYSVDAIIAAYQWAPSNPRHSRSVRFVNALADGLEGLQTYGYQPAWQRVNLAIDTPNVQTLPIVSTVLEQRAANEAFRAEAARLAEERAAAEAAARQQSELVSKRDELIEQLGAELSEADAAEFERLSTELESFLKTLK